MPPLEKRPFSQPSLSPRSRPVVTRPVWDYDDNEDFFLRVSDTLHQRVLATIRRHGMVAAGDRVGVAVSGGADSAALLLILGELVSELGISLSVIHFNHQLRGAEADADEQFARELATQASLEFHLMRADVAAEARRNGWNLEDAGRRLRSGFFQELVAQRRVNRVAVAHTADDQAETVLAHLFRGSGPGGLAGIYPVADPVIRPLLEVRRTEARAFLSQRGQPWREDASNRDTTRLRARLRHQLIPQLEKEYQPALVDRLCQLAELAHGEEQFWDALLEERVRCSASAEVGVWTIAAHELSSAKKPSPGGDAAHPALARRLVRRLLDAAAGHHLGVNAEHVERVLELARRGRGGQRVELPGNLLVERTLDHRLRFRVSSEETKTGQTPYHYDVRWPFEDGATVEVGEVRSRFRLKLIDWPLAASETRVAQVLLDAGLLIPPLVLRNWRPGDAYRPAGHHRVYKLKELLYRARVEAEQRAAWPVLVSAGRVVWARGFPPAAECAAGDGTRAGLWIAEERIEG